MMPQPPCKDCVKRHLGCHASCNEYQEFTEERLHFNLQMSKINGYAVYEDERKAKYFDKKVKKKQRGGRD